MKSAGSASPEVISAIYDGEAKNYDEKRLRTSYQLRFDSSERRILRRYLSGYENVLEVGAGTGRLTGELLKCSGRVTVVDISPGMLAQLEQKFPDDEKLSLHVRDVYTLESFPGYGEFDALLTMRMLPHIENIARVLEILKGVVRPGGVLMFDFWNRNSYLYKKKRGAAVYNNYVTYEDAKELIVGSGLDLIAFEGAGFKSRFDANLEFLGRTPLKRFGYSLIAICRRPLKAEA